MAIHQNTAIMAGNIGISKIKIENKIENIKGGYIYRVGEMWANIVKNDDKNGDNVEKESVLEDDSYDDLTSSDDEEIAHKLKIAKNKTLKMNFEDKDEDESFGWRPENTKEAKAPQIIKRYRLKKLKSPNSQTYYYDNTYYYIWEYLANEDKLVKPTDSNCDLVRGLNSIVFKPFIPQPDEFW
jgi:hypothetical protein